MDESVEQREKTICGLFAQSAIRFAEHVAIRNVQPMGNEPQEITYARLEEDVARVAAALHRMHVRKGDRVALISRPRIRFATCVLAALKLGAWVVPIDPEFTTHELGTLLGHADPKIVVGSSDVSARLLESGVPFVDLDDSVGIPFAALLDEPVGSFPGPEGRDIAFLAYTSGTTGDPKGVMLSHANIVADLVNGTKVIPVLPDDVFLAIAPWHHILGLVACLVLPLYGDWRRWPDR